MTIWVYLKGKNLKPAWIGQHWKVSLFVSPKSTIFWIIFVFIDHCFITGVRKLEPRDQIQLAWGLFCMAPQLTLVFERVVPTASMWERHDEAASWALCHLVLHREPWGCRKILAQGLDGEFSVFAWKHFVLPFLLNTSYNIIHWRVFSPVLPRFYSCVLLLCHFCCGLWQYNPGALEGGVFLSGCFWTLPTSSYLILSLLIGPCLICLIWGSFRLLFLAFCHCGTLTFKPTCL